MTDHLPSRPDPENEGLRTPHDISTPELNEIQVRRYVAYLENSLDKGTQWAVFEPNGEALWARVRSSVTDFLTAEWRSGKLQGAAVEQAFFVHCDQSTMTQNDLDNGRLTIVVGVAPVKPSEFVVINIGQWTAGHKP
jgi:phage tail sheath protein FI